MYYRRPSKLSKSDSKKHTDELYDTKNSTDKKKFIANKNMGLIERKMNSSSITKIYKTLIEARYYQIKYGGYIYCLSVHNFVEVEPSEEDKMMVLDVSSNKMTEKCIC